MNPLQDDQPPSLPPRIPRRGPVPAAEAHTPPNASGASSWSIRSVGLASLGLGAGGLGGSIVAWIIMGLVHAAWGIGTSAEWIAMLFALLPLALFGLAVAVHKPAVAAGAIGIALVKLTYQLYRHGAEGLLRSRPFDVAGVAEIAGIVWGLAGGVLGSMAGESAKATAGPEAHTSSPVT